MAQSLSANDCLEMVGRPAGDFVTALKPVSVQDFMERTQANGVAAAHRRARLANDARESVPQSQVDQLISDLMDIIVRAAAANGGETSSQSTEAVAEVVALSMMQALLQKQVCSSY
jgi:hypothetical protein